MFELIRSWQEIRRKLAGKKTYIMSFLTGVLVAMKIAGYPIPEFIWPILGALDFGAIKGWLDKIKPPKIPEG